jgi:hypothetical protein
MAVRWRCPPQSQHPGCQAWPVAPRPKTLPPLHGLPRMVLHCQARACPSDSKLRRLRSAPTPPCLEVLSQWEVALLGIVQLDSVAVMRLACLTCHERKHSGWPSAAMAICFDGACRAALQPPAVDLARQGRRDCLAGRPQRARSAGATASLVCHRVTHTAPWGPDPLEAMHSRPSSRLYAEQHGIPRLACAPRSCSHRTAGLVLASVQ